MKYSLWQNAWNRENNSPIYIDLPDDWNVEYHKMPADDMFAISKDEIARRVSTPLRAYLQSLIEPNEAVIVFDDLSRGTRCREIAECVLGVLAEHGITDEHIRFICATGTHGTLHANDFVCKLGEDIVTRYPVFNHNAFDNLMRLGVTTEGVPIFVNAEFMRCQIRIGIGSVAPHPLCGYGGGGKLIYPGIAGYETTVRHHLLGGTTIPGSTDDNAFRDRIGEMLQMVPDFFLINTVINARLDNVAVFAGTPEIVYASARRISERVNRISLGTPKDVVIINANAKGNEASISIRIAEEELKVGGDVVLVNHCKRGMVVHYGSGAFGRNTGGPRWKPYEQRSRQKPDRIIYFSPYPDFAGRYQFNEPDKVIFAKTWEEVMTLLGNHGAGTNASVFSDGTISYFNKG